MDTNRIMNLLGLACRAGKIVCGEYAVAKYLKKKRVPLLFLAHDGSPSVQESYRRIAETKEIPVIDIFSKVELGQAVGKSQHVVVLLTDRGFARAIEKVTNTNS